MSTSNKENYKVLVLGQAKTGKTSIIKRFINNEFKEEYTPTNNIDFSIINVEIKEPNNVTVSDYANNNTEKKTKSIQMCFWDVAGSNEENKFNNVYYKDADVAIIVFDVSSDKSFSSITTWLRDLRNNTEKNIPIFVIGNKIDLTHYNVDPLVEYCKNNNINEGFSLISALKNKGVTSTMHHIIDMMTNINSDTPKSHNISMTCD